MAASLASRVAWNRWFFNALLHSTERRRYATNTALATRLDAFEQTQTLIRRGPTRIQTGVSVRAANGCRRRSQ
jgi:hypothetical protein